jgi:ABC-type uncharacterized transport system permease subunit
MHPFMTPTLAGALAGLAGALIVIFAAVHVGRQAKKPRDSDRP